MEILEKIDLVINRPAIILCLLLAGCGAKGGGVIDEIMSHRAMAQEQGPPTEVVLEPQQALTMPTDLQLPAPSGQTVDDTGARTRVLSKALSIPQEVAPEGEAQPIADPYEAYGISKVHADGTPKTREELRKELRAAWLKRKRLKDPNYGTVMNLPNIFK